MSHVLLKVWKTEKFFNVTRHGQVSSGDIKITSFFKVAKTDRFFEFMKKLDKYFRRGEKNTRFFEYMKNHKFFKVMRNKQVFQIYEKIWSVVEKVMKITSLISKTWKKSQVLDEPTLLLTWSVKRKFTND